MTKMTWPLAAALALALSGPALAADQIGYANSNVDPNTTSVSPQNPLPVGNPQAIVIETTAAMTGLWVKAWTAAPARRLIIGLPSTSAASGDYSFNAALVGTATAGGVPFSGGAGGSFDFGGGAVPNSDLYVKATSGSSVTVQVFN